eukprot:sb/3479268/
MSIGQYTAYLVLSERTAPILMKLGQNSVWCLIRSEKIFSAQILNLGFLGFLGFSAFMVVKNLSMTWFYSFCSRTFLKPIKAEKPKNPKNPKFRI